MRLLSMQMWKNVQCRQICLTYEYSIDMDVDNNYMYLKKTYLK